MSRKLANSNSNPRFKEKKYYLFQDTRNDTPTPLNTIETSINMNLNRVEGTNISKDDPEQIFQYNLYLPRSLKNASSKSYVASPITKGLTSSRNNNNTNLNSINDYKETYINIKNLLESIIHKYEYDINNNNNNKEKLIYFLNEVFKMINLLIKKIFYKPENIKDDLNINKININDKNKMYFNPNLTNYNNTINNDYNSINNISFRHTIYKMNNKLKEKEKKFKIDELNYLFYIGEQHKKINLLENKLRLNESKEEFFNSKRNFINQKYFKINNRNLFKSKSKFLSTENKEENNEDNEEEKENDNENDNISERDSMETINNNNNNKSKSKNKENKNSKTIENEKNYSDIHKNFDYILDMINNGKKNFKILKTFDDKYLDKFNYLISHPNLSFLGYGNKCTSGSAKENEKLNTLPKNLARFKMNSKSRKNAFISFPSSLNETIVNLEKLKTDRTFRNLKERFDETYKKRPKTKSGKKRH